MVQAKHNDYEYMSVLCRFLKKLYKTAQARHNGYERVHKQLLFSPRHADSHS